MAINRRFPISDEQRLLMVQRAIGVLETSKKNRDILAAEKVLIAMESQNQRDEHKLIDARVQQRNIELDAIAAELGIEANLIADVQGEGGTCHSVVEEQPAVN